MSDQWDFSGIYGVIGGIATVLIKNIAFSSNDAKKDDLTELRVHVAETYIRKDELKAYIQDRKNEINNDTDRIIREIEYLRARIDTKLDKSKPEDHRRND